MKSLYLLLTRYYLHHSWKLVSGCGLMWLCHRHRSISWTNTKSLKLPVSWLSVTRCLASCVSVIGLNARIHQMGWALAHSDLGRKERSVGLDAVTSGAPVEFTAGMHRPGKGRAPSTSPAGRHPAPSTLADLSGLTSQPICSTVPWPGSCPVPTAQPLALGKKLGERSELVGWGGHLRIGLAKAGMPIRRCLK